jgi:hypothetical protein
MKLSCATALLLLSGFVVHATINHPENGLLAHQAIQDDVWAVMEFPQGRDIVLELVATAALPDAKGTARVLRGWDGTEVTVEAAGLSGEVESYHVFAIDSLGKASALGPLTVSDGVGYLRAQSALTKFMIIISPKDDVVILAAETPILLRSRVPEGYQVVPRGNGPTNMTEAPGSENEEVPSLVPDYEIPILGITSLKRRTATLLRARLFDELEGSRISASVKPGRRGITQVSLTFRDLKPAADGKHYVVWAVSSDKAYSALGTAAPGKQSKLSSSSELGDFGVFITLEDSEAPLLPIGKMVAMFVR